MERTANKIILGPRYQVRIEDMRKPQLLRLHCLACRHTGFLDIDTLRRRLPPYQRLNTIQHTFRCRRCQTRGAVHWDVVTFG